MTAHITPRHIVHRVPRGFPQARWSMAAVASRALDMLPYRVRQVVAFTQPQQPPVVPDEIAACLLPGTMERYRELPAADQRHLLAVGQTLRANGEAETCWLAGFLHDIGKGHNGHHLGTFDRCLWVLVSRRPFLVAMVRNRGTMPRFGRGLWIAANHATLGGAILRELGYPDRICDLVVQHEDTVLASKDAALRQLQAADNAPSSIPMDARRAAHGRPA